MPLKNAKVMEMVGMSPESPVFQLYVRKFPISIIVRNVMSGDFLFGKMVHVKSWIKVDAIQTLPSLESIIVDMNHVANTEFCNMAVIGESLKTEGSGPCE